MQKLIEGLHQFRSQIFPSRRDFFDACPEIAHQRDRTGCVGCVDPQRYVGGNENRLAAVEFGVVRGASNSQR